jgi:hypothetical protein
VAQGLRVHKGQVVHHHFLVHWLRLVVVAGVVILLTESPEVQAAVVVLAQ